MLLRDLIVALLIVWASPVLSSAAEAPLRPPAVPLVVVDPYLSTWSCADRLYDNPTRHWTGKDHAMTGLIRVDGKTYRFMGKPEFAVPPLEQRDLTVHPTKTVYRFAGAGIELHVTFLTPALPADLDRLSRPVTYVMFKVRSTDREPHHTSIYFDATAQWAVNTEDQEVVPSRHDVEGDVPLSVVRIGTTAQRILQTAGDDVRIDWGYLYLSALRQTGTRVAITSTNAARALFARTGQAVAADDDRFPRAADDEMPGLSCVFDLGEVNAQGTSRHLVLAYDDLFSIEYFHTKLRPWWRRNGMDMSELLVVSEQELPELSRRCDAFDEAFWTESRQVAGERYARLCALAFRQCLGAHKLVADTDGTPLYFSKENFSSGLAGTVDVTFPSAPFFMHYNTTLLKSQLRPVFTYARSEAWKFPFAPHDVGMYPQVNGQLYGRGLLKGQMPVEESGNILILAAAIAGVEGNTDFASEYWDELTAWAKYLRENGLDPGDQLCTSDMFGHLAHNADLSLKAILGIGAYAQLCAKRGMPEEAKKYRATAEEFAREWQQMAKENSYTRLAFDRPGTWGMKHNLIWDRVLQLHLFPNRVGDGETSLYLAKQNRYGLPCDSRTKSCLIDWGMWSICLARNAEDFDELVTPFYRYIDETPSRVPLCDWFFTTNATRVNMQARSTVGGLFIRHLVPAEADAPRVARGASATRAERDILLPTADQGTHWWRYETEKPAPRWRHWNFGPAGWDWKSGPAAFGTKNASEKQIGTTWNSPEIYLRSQVEWDSTPYTKAIVRIRYRGEAIVYLNDQELLKVRGNSDGYEEHDVTERCREALPHGLSILAVECHQTGKEQCIDVGLAIEPK
ncbi:MAG: DUF4965 domain-containing protein [Gammaproteobacteria bacterium]|nr:DUF4965 domain-containing protein [Gammaproteobacteria bacterium]